MPSFLLDPCAREETPLQQSYLTWRLTAPRLLGASQGDFVLSARATVGLSAM
ncbi:hypothetical protein [Sorangium sp. So ce861]|uniref:hypothetical protein n=1 Tax=Sorangium sp. So ce861 TaxID=3133323 RepID=UPI003F63D98F